MGLLERESRCLDCVDKVPIFLLRDSTIAMLSKRYDLSLEQHPWG